MARTGNICPEYHSRPNCRQRTTLTMAVGGAEADRDGSSISRLPIGSPASRCEPTERRPCSQPHQRYRRGEPYSGWTEVTIDVLPGHHASRVGVLTGPNLAAEIVAGQPAATVVAMEDMTIARRLQKLFMTPTFRVYTNTDVAGCESAGALKNVMAIAAGMAHGLGFGDNTMATLITRALAELTRLGVAMGGEPQTFAGLAGIGDLTATCMSEKSRNHTIGYGLGSGKSLDIVLGEMKEVAEGVKSTRGVLAIADRHRVEMPIAEQVGRVLYDGALPADAVATLMTREAQSRDGWD